MDLFLMSPPAPGWAVRGRANFRSALGPVVHPRAARREWLALARAIERHGGKVAVLPPDDALTGLPYAAEAGHPLPPAAPGGRPRFLLSRMKPAHRRGEPERWRPFVAELGFEPIDLGAGTWEGQGDVAWFDGATLMFFGGRTDREGLEAARRHVAGEVLVIQVREPAFHGNMAVLPLPAADQLLVCPDTVEDDGLAVLEARFGRDRIHFVSEEESRGYATNGLPIGRALLAPHCTPPRVSRLLAGAGVSVEALSMVELCEKAGGAARCLACVCPDVPDDLPIPERARLAAWEADLS
jgi:N-dimethylarginine dimethylaminohydrolase